MTRLRRNNTLPRQEQQGDVGFTKKRIMENNSEVKELGEGFIAFNSLETGNGVL